jgi:hypothetical protein
MRDTHPAIAPFMPPGLREAQDQALRDLVLPFGDRRRGDDLIQSFPATFEYFIGHLKSRSFFEKMREASEESAQEYVRAITDAIKKACNAHVGSDSDEEFLKLCVQLDYHYAVELGRKLE